MSEITDRMDELAELMDEFGLRKARLGGEEWSVEFSVDPPGSAVAVVPGPAGEETGRRERRARATEPSRPTATGTPVTSPTTGIFYSSPNPGAPSFVKVGDRVDAGQVIGLIEAMKVFNEITATISGTVLSVAVQNGQLVQPGDPLVYIG